MQESKQPSELPKAEKWRLFNEIVRPKLDEVVELMQTLGINHSEDYVTHEIDEPLPTFEYDLWIALEVQ